MESYRYSGKNRPGEALVKTQVYPPCLSYMRSYANLNANLLHPQMLGVWWSCDPPMPGPFPAPPPKPGKSALGTRLFCSMKNKWRKLIFLLFSGSRVDLFVKKQNCRNLSLIFSASVMISRVQKPLLHQEVHSACTFSAVISKTFAHTLAIYMFWLNFYPWFKFIINF